MSDIGYIKAGIDAVNMSGGNRAFALAERIAKVEGSSKQNHRRIDWLDNIDGEWYFA